LGREFLSFFLRCFVDDLPASIMLASGVLQRGLGVLRERVRTWVVLSSPLAQPGARQLNSLPGVTRLA
jgi:hypothetical protein